MPNIKDAHKRHAIQSVNFWNDEKALEVSPYYNRYCDVQIIYWQTKVDMLKKEEIPYSVG